MNAASWGTPAVLLIVAMLRACPICRALATLGRLVFMPIPPNTAADQPLSSAHAVWAALKQGARWPHAPSVAFFAAVNGCKIPTSALPPVAARATGLMDSFAQWAASLFSQDQGKVLFDLMRDQRRTALQCVETLANQLQVDPLYRSGRVGLHGAEERSAAAIQGAVPLVFWLRGGQIIEPTDALQQWLAHSDLHDDLPLDLLRLPWPACFITLSEATSHALLPMIRATGMLATRIRGVYLFESTREEARALTAVTVCENREMRTSWFQTTDVIINDEQRSVRGALEEAVERSELPLPVRAFDEAIFAFCAKLILYLSTPQAVRRDELAETELRALLERLGPKKAAKRLRQLETAYDRIVVGPTQLPTAEAADGLISVSPHWRRGHFAMQPYGPNNSLRKVIFRAPTLVRADRLGESPLAPTS